MLTREIYLEQLRPLIGLPAVKLVTGLRGSGKSTLLRQLGQSLRDAGIPEDYIISINLELMEAAEVSNDVRLLSYIRYRMVNPGRHFIFLDEIQMVDNWTQAVAELAADDECDLYLAGSDAGRLAAALSEVIPGQFTEIRVLPLSLSECVQMAGERPDSAEADPQGLAAAYLRRGGLPQLAAVSEDTEAEQNGLNLFRAILYQDVVLPGKIRDAELLNRIIRYILTNTGKIYAVKSIGDYLAGRDQRASAETIANYLSSLEEAGLICRVPRLDLRTGQVLHSNVKYYLADHGLLRAVTGQKDRNSAGMLQNAVCIELIRRGCTVTVGRLGDRIIDFVAEKNGRRWLIQILERRVTADLLKAAAEPMLKARQADGRLIVTRDMSGLNPPEGVICRSLAEFLLDSSLL